ncbi:ROK family protein [Streptomyces iconiensis]|uniref:ROK family protein n=1 Tax=Streptomyces iconiensis TaxID=1384038 RepID=A0ABT7A011_9ACTN|nr:ROK family protein [Streptomyces iconiensis]MDJ1134673.1 ROK family protein [Streptomyces iconiensis]
MTAQVLSEKLPTPVLDVGGTHVTAALVETASGLPLPGSVVREPLDSDDGAGEILDALAATARRLRVPHSRDWGVAIPGPFDYATGTGRFRGIGKFEALHGVDVGSGLCERLGQDARTLHFLNDADAFALGEHRAGAAAGHDRVVCLTLGTGVGSSFLAGGTPVHRGPGVPPGGHVHRLTVRGQALEDVVSRRAIRAKYASLSRRSGTGPLPDVREIAARARRREASAAQAIGYAFQALGHVLAPWCREFGATAVVVGGSMSASWDLVEAGLAASWAEETFGRNGPPALLKATRSADAALVGAARRALDPRPEP